MKAVALFHDSAKFIQKAIKILTFSVSFASMFMGLSFIPLFPQPLPLIISFLISFMTLNDHREGMIIGSFIICSGLIYHMSRINFILILGSTEMKLLFLSILIVFFLFTPIKAKRNEDIIAISIGIISACMLFFNQTYFFAIPLMIVFAGIYKKQRIWLTLSYYAAISTPIQIMQYMKYIYNEKYHTLPPLYVPLLDIFNDIQESMRKISINEISRVLEIIAGQLKSRPSPSLNFMINALSEYINSLPGVILFLIIMFSLVSITAYIMSNSLKIMEGLEVTKRYSKYIEIFFPVITVTITTTFFYTFLTILQEPLSYMADINLFKMTIGIIGAAITTIPISFMNNEIKTNKIRDEHSEIIIKKSEKLIEELEYFHETIKRMGRVIPVNLDSLKREFSSIEEKLNDIIYNVEHKMYDLNELENKIYMIETQINQELNNLNKKINTILDEYYRNENYEFNLLLENYKKIGINLKVDHSVEYKEDEPIEIKLEKISKISNREWQVTEQIVEIYERIYNIIRIFYDSSLQEENPTLIIAKQEISKRELPCVVLEAIYVSINNLEIQFSKEIIKTINNLNKLIESTENILHQKETLTITSKQSHKSFMEIKGKIKNLKDVEENNHFKIANTINLYDIIIEFLNFFKEMFQSFLDELKLKEKQIEQLVLDKRYEWIKNNIIKEKIEYIIHNLNRSTLTNLNQIIFNLDTYLVNLTEYFDVISYYNETQEILVNYEISELIINNLLREKHFINLNELPFNGEIAKKYMQIYGEKNKDKVIFDVEKFVIYWRDEYNDSKSI
jgi:hypothetical protein